MGIRSWDRSNQSENLRIFEIFKKAYEVEADLLGVSRHLFFPLQLALDDLKNTLDEVWVLDISGTLAGAIFLEKSQDSITISNLVVDPKFFRQGIAKSLITLILKSYPNLEFFVRTGALNFPAIQLYQKFQFLHVSEETVEHNIRILKLKRHRHECC